MTVVSVDLAYKKYRDIGIAVLESSNGGIICDFVRPAIQGIPEPTTLARYLSDLCTERQSDLLLLDGPQLHSEPLSDPELFLSFARLGAHGEPSENKILSWISKYGLLRASVNRRVPYASSDDTKAFLSH